MGIRQFTKFYNNNIKTCSANILEYEKVVIDAHQLLYSRIRAIKSSGLDNINIYGKNVNHIFAIIHEIIMYVKNNVYPIFIFDGLIPKEKQYTQKKRNMRKEKNKIIYNNCDNKYSIDAIKSLKNTIKITVSDIDDCITIIKYFGFPVIRAHGEADSLCAYISQYYKNEIAGVVTGDTDILIYGGTRIFSELSFKKNTINIIDRASVYETLLEKANNILLNYSDKVITKFLPEHFILMSLFMGSDYRVPYEDGTFGNTKIIGIPNDEIFKLFVLCNFDLNLLQKECLKYDNVVIPKNFVINCEYLLNMYINKSNKHNPPIDITMGEFDIYNLIEFICNKNKIDKKIIRGYLLSIISNMNKMLCINNKKYCLNCSSFEQINMKNKICKLT
jgi:5'-3' exonuclease